MMSANEVEAARNGAVEIETAERGLGPAKKKKGLLLGLNGYALACALLASTNSILLGYDIGVMNGAMLFIKKEMNLTLKQEEIAIGSLNVISIVGSLLSGKTSDLIGRRYTIVLAAATFLIGALLMGLAPTYIYLLAGRLVAGVGVGYALMIAPLYVAELSPAMTRGFLSSLPEVFITFGVLLGYIMNLALKGLPEQYNWRLMLGIAGIPAIGVGIGVILMPESPRWLVMKGRIDDAHQVLVRTSESDAEAEMRLQEISEAALEEEMKGKQKGVWTQLLISPTKPIRRVVVAALGINFFMQASGNDAIIYYSTRIFAAAGLKVGQQIAATVVMGISKTSFCLLSALVLDNYGRRPMLMLGTAGMSISMFALALTQTILNHATHYPVWGKVSSIFSVCAFVSFFSIGLGPITWVYTAEIFPLALRAQGTALSFSLNRAVSGVVSMTFLSMSKAITFGGVAFVFAVFSTVGSVYFYFLLPETKGRTLEEIHALFEKGSDLKRPNTNNTEARS